MKMQVNNSTTVFSEFISSYCVILLALCKHLRVFLIYLCHYNNFLYLDIATKEKRPNRQQGLCTTYQMSPHFRSATPGNDSHIPYHIASNGKNTVLSGTKPKMSPFGKLGWLVNVPFFIQVYVGVIAVKNYISSLIFVYVSVGPVILDQRKKIMNKMKQNQKQGVKEDE